MQGGSGRHIVVDVQVPRGRASQRDQLAVRSAAPHQQAACRVQLRAEAGRQLRQEAGHFHPIAAHRPAHEQFQAAR